MNFLTLRLKIGVKKSSLSFCHETGPASTAERVIYTLKTLVKRLTTADNPKINRKNWDTYLLDLEQVINSTPCSYSGYTLNQLDDDDRDGKAKRMLDRLKLQKKRKAQWKHNNVTRVKNEKLKILKPLPVNTLVFVRYRKDRDQDTKRVLIANRPHAPNCIGTDVYRVTKVSFLKNVTLQNYTPSHRYAIVHTLSGEKRTVKRKDVHPIHLTDKERYLKTLRNIKKSI